MGVCVKRRKRGVKRGAGNRDDGRSPGFVLVKVRFMEVERKSAGPSFSIP